MPIPNILSIIRLILVPVFAIVYFQPHGEGRIAALVVFVVACLTDVLDGYIARRYNQISELGKVIDPLADKLMQCTAITCLVITGIIPIWVIVILALKELAILIGGSCVSNRIGVVVHSRWFGKLSTVVINVTVALVILFPGIPYSVRTGLFLLAIVMAVIAMILYAKEYFRVIKNMNKDKDTPAKDA